MQINQDTQQELAYEITSQFGNLADLLLDNSQAYRLCAQLNMKCAEYFEKAVILLQVPKEYTTL